MTDAFIRDRKWDQDERMTDRDEFLTWVNTALYDAERALHNGEAAPPPRALVAQRARQRPASVAQRERANGSSTSSSPPSVRASQSARRTNSSCSRTTWSATWPLPPASSTPRPPSTAGRARTPCGPRRSTAARRVSGGSRIVMGTPCPVEETSLAPDQRVASARCRQAARSPFLRLPPAFDRAEIGHRAIASRD
jgi:hypothetical protein